MPAPTTTTRTPDSLWGAALRLIWMFLGPVGLALSLAQLAVGSTGPWGGADLLPWVFCAGVVVARYVDVRTFKGSTAEGTPATMAHWRAHALKVMAVTALAWSGLELAMRG